VAHRYNEFRCLSCSARVADRSVNAVSFIRLITKINDVQADDGTYVRISGEQKRALDLLCPEMEISSIDWAQLSTFYLKTETDPVLETLYCEK
jgi:hypothetical protein